MVRNETGTFLEKNCMLTDFTKNVLLIHHLLFVPYYISDSS